MSELGLADAIGQLRAEIGKAMQQADGESLQFVLGPVELELQVQVEVKGSAKIDAKWVVVSIGAEAGADRGSTHKVKLTLTPQARGRSDVRVNDVTARPG